MKPFALRSAFLLTLLGTAFAASAQTIFYGGDPEPFGFYSQRGSTADALLFQDFTLGTSTQIGSVFGNFALVREVGALTGLHYEIRQNVGPFDEGTLLFSGDVAANIAPNGDFTDGTPIYTVTGLVSGVTLGPGKYFLGLAGIDTTNGSVFLAATDGTNAKGSSSGSSYLYSQGGELYFLPTSFLTQGDAVQFSMGLQGSPVASAVPGPVAALPFALIALRRRKRS